VRTLIGAVGYRNLRDFSAAFEVIARLEGATHLCSESERGEGGCPLGPDVVIEDTAYNPIAVVQWLQSLEDSERFDRAIFISALERGRTPGMLTAYRWDGGLPPDDQIQQAVTEAVTGIIALENTVVIAGYFKVLPPEVVIIEIEPLDHEFGPELSTPVRAAIAPVVVLVRRLALDPDAIDDIPVASLPLRHAQKARTL